MNIFFSFNLLLRWLFFRWWHHFLFLGNIEKFKKSLCKVLDTFKNIMENGAFAPNEQMLHLHTGLENSTRPLVFTSVSGCRASEYIDISTEN